jgi:hypothetical protein
VSFSSRFYRGAALCSLASALTTLGLIFLPRFYTPVPNFEARMALLSNPAYVLRSWVYLVHPFLVVTAAVAVAVSCRRHAAGAATLGTLGFCLWGATEAGQQALTLVALDGTWRRAWATADEAARELIRSHVAVYDALWNSMFFLLLLGFFAGNVLLALAVRHHGGLARWVSVAFWVGAGLTAIELVPELGGPSLSGPFVDALYPLTQPAARALIGVWLWREATRDGRSATPNVTRDTA